MPIQGILNEVSVHEALATILESATPDGVAPINVGTDLYLALIRGDQAAVLRESSTDTLARAVAELVNSGEDDAADVVAAFEAVCRLEARFGKFFRRLRHITGNPQPKQEEGGGR
jgi:hypothetical protein